MAQPSMRRVRRRLSRRNVLKTAIEGGGGLAGSVLLAGCGRQSGRGVGTASPSPQDGGGPAQRGGTFYFPGQNNPPTLDPQRATAGSALMPIAAAMSRLFRFKIGLDPQVAINHDLGYDLARSAESPDAATWTIKLRPDASFHNLPPVNGHAVEAEDVKATFTRAFDPKNPSRGALAMIDPVKIETPDKNTVVFRLNYPYAPLPSILVSPSYGAIFPREVLAGGYDPAKQIIGSVPFIFDSYTPDVAIVLKQNPNWHEKGLPYVDEVRYPIVHDPAQQLAQFAAGHLDALEPLQNALDAVKRSNPSAHLITAPGGSASAYFFQLGDPASPFQDIRLRQAVSLAIDHDSLGKVVCDNQCEPVLSVPPSMGKWALKVSQLEASSRQYYSFNLPQAKKLLQEAGGSDLDVKLVYPTNYTGAQSRAQIAQTIYAMLKALPWNISLLPIDYAKDYLGGGKGMFYGNFPSNYMVIAGGTPLSETDQFLFSIYHSKSTSSVTRLKDPTLDAMIDKARTITDAETRRKAYLDVQSYIAGKVYTMAGLPSENKYMAIQPRVRNFNYSLETATYSDSWARLWLKGVAGSGQ